MEVQLNQEIGWPIRNKELHNRNNEVKVKADNIKPFFVCSLISCLRTLFPF